MIFVRNSGRFPRVPWGISTLLTLALAGACRQEVRSPERAVDPPASPSRAAVEAVDPPRQPRPRPRPGVILVGLDGADWALLDRLASTGKMPNLARVVREGRTAKLTSFVPILSPIVWTSIATGATPEVHGVLDFQEVDPATGGVVPISGRSRRVPAIWNIASSAGRRVGVTGWWATDPAEEVSGFFVTDHASSILFEGSTDAVAYPPGLSAGVRKVREDENRIPDSDLASFLSMTAPEIAAQRSTGGGLENPVVALAKILGATRTVQRIARDLYDRERPDLTAVYFEGTDAIGHVFAADVPPRLACTPEEDFRRYSGVVDAYYALIDRLLGQWMRRAQEDGSVLLIGSDHGFKWGDDRTCRRSSLNWTTAAFWHRLDGVLAAWGPGVAPAADRGSASVYDLAPTVAALLELPVDPKMTGRPLLSWFPSARPPQRREVFSSVKVNRVAAAPLTAAQRDEYAKELRALGYLSGSESRSAPREEGPWPGRTEGAWNNLGLFQREAGRYDEAERNFRESLRIRPNYSSPMFNLAVSYRTQGRMAPAREWLFRSLEAGHADPEQTILQWAAAVRPLEARLVLEEGSRRYPASEPVAVELAKRRLDEKDCRGAAGSLAPFAEKGGRDALNFLGVSELCLENPKAARSHFERSLAIDPAQPNIREALRMLDRTGPPN